jgi:ubiquinone/menaquinone biosynthesis C-methylase UbiE
MSATSEQQLLASRKARFWEETDYDRAFRGSFGQYMTAVEAAALDRVFPSARPRLLLDLGCGHGRFLRWLAPRAAKLVGLDRSWRLLRVARAGQQQAPLPVPCELVHGSAQDLPFASRSIDAITCVRVVQHLPDQDQALSEIQRVLTPGGSLVLVQYNLISPHGFIRALKLPIKALIRRLLRLTGREPKFDEPTQWASIFGLRAQLQRAGFEIERETGAWLFPLQYLRSKRSNDAWLGLDRLAYAIERLADIPPFRYGGGYLIVRCRPK